jgi:hypothetical protein
MDAGRFHSAYAQGQSDVGVPSFFPAILVGEEGEERLVDRAANAAALLGGFVELRSPTAVLPLENQTVSAAAGHGCPFSLCVSLLHGGRELKLGQIDWHGVGKGDA